MRRNWPTRIGASWPTCWRAERVQPLYPSRRSSSASRKALISARKENRSVEELTAHYNARQQADFAGLGIEFDV